MKKHRYKYPFFISVFCLTFLVLFFPKQAKADSTYLTVSPSIIRIEAKPPADIWTPFILSNNSNQSISVKIGYKAINPQASSNGTIVFLNEGQPMPGLDTKIFNKIDINGRRLAFQDFDYGTPIFLGSLKK